MSTQALVGNGLILLGAALIGAAAVGLVRLPDLYHRASAVAKAASLGVCLVLTGTAVLDPRPVTAITLLIAIIAQLLTAPIAGYSVGRAGYRTGTPLAPDTHRGDHLP